MSKMDMRGAPAPTREMARTLTAVRNADGGFDVDAWHAMDQRDNALISDEMMHGAGSSKFVYQFSIAGTQVTGISVVGARHLASHYGGIKHRLIAAIQKTGELFTFTSYPAPNVPMHVQCSIVPELRDEPDFYGAIVEITDIKTGNTVQVECRESRFEQKRDGTSYERPHYATIAQAKAFRNGVLSIVPQDAQIEWKMRMLSLGKNDVITGSVIDEKRAGVLKFAAAKAIAVDRRAVEALTMDQISGLSEAARTGSVDAFSRSAAALGLMRGAIEAHERSDGPAATQGQRQPPSAQEPQQGRPGPAAAAASGAQAQQPPPFEAYLVGDDGEIADDVFTDPERFIRRLIEIADVSENETAILEHNEGAIAEACAASDRARSLYEDWQRNADLKGAEQKYADLAVADVRGKPDWAGYVRELKDRIAGATAERIVGLAEHHRPTWKDAPAAQRMLIVKAIMDRCKAVGVAQPEWLAGMMVAKVPTQEQAQGLPLGEPAQDKPVAATAGEIETYCKRTATWLLGLTDGAALTTWEADPVTRQRRDVLRENWPQHSDYLERAIADAHTRLMRPEDAP